MSATGFVCSFFAAGAAMNTYEHKFTVNCEKDDVIIHYKLTIVATKTIMVEDIIEACDIDSGYQEQIAETLHKQFGGEITLEGTHSAVKVTTRL